MRAPRAPAYWIQGSITGLIFTPTPPRDASPSRGLAIEEGVLLSQQHPLLNYLSCDICFYRDVADRIAMSSWKDFIVWQKVINSHEFENGNVNLDDDDE